MADEHLPDPQSVLGEISISKYVREDYRNLYGMSDDKPIWDNSKDWIRTADWEAIRSELAGTTVRFAIGAADTDRQPKGWLRSKSSPVSRSNWCRAKTS